MKDLETRVNAITESLEKGKSGPVIAREFSRLWGVSERTLRSYIAIAKEQMNERGKAKQAIIEEIRKDAIVKAAKEDFRLYYLWNS
ncbi:MAG: hypothetical protein ACLQQ4_14325 [Bacteroidia bacterium]